MEYELFYLVGSSKESELPQIKERTEKIIVENGGKFSEKETMERRRLSYKVGRETHGTYTARRFDLENIESLKEINSKINLNSGVLRFIISKASELPELKSKEERMNEASQRRSPQMAKPEKPAARKSEEAKKESPKKEPEAKKEEKSAKSEDIDKKLEEILNI